jgi:hypothetical protein
MLPVGGIIIGLLVIALCEVASRPFERGDR